jgi:hypothetical protein
MGSRLPYTAVELFLSVLRFPQLFGNQSFSGGHVCGRWIANIEAWSTNQKSAGWSCVHLRRTSKTPKNCWHLWGRSIDCSPTGRHGSTRSVGAKQAQILLQIASDAGKYIVCISTDQSHGADNKDKNYGKHHSIFSDVLTFIARPNISYELRHKTPRGRESTPRPLPTQCFSFRRWPARFRL